MTAQFQELQPSIPVEHLEVDRIHRALTILKAEGLPRDIVAKFHLYCTKEQLLAAAQGKESLTFQGHSYHLFADFSPITVAKRRALQTLHEQSYQ